MRQKFLLDLDPALMESAEGRFKRFLGHPFGLPILVFVALVLVSGLVIGWMIWRGSNDLSLKARNNYIVIVNYDGQRRVLPTDEKTVGDLIKRLKIKLNNGDRVEPDLTEEISGDNYLVNIYRSAPIAIIDGGKTILVSSAAKTPRSVVAESEVKLYAEDIVHAELTDNFLTQRSLGYRAVIDRAIPVNLQLYGKQIEMRTQVETVAEFLKEKGVQPGKDDTVRPGLDAELTPGMQLAVLRNGIQTITVDEEIPALTQTIIDMSMSFGSQAVRQEGAPGKKTNTYEIKVENGYEVSRRLIQSVRVVEPVTRVVAKGNTVNIPSDKQNVMAAAGIKSSDYGYVDYIFSHESHWNAAALNSIGCAGLGQACPGSKLVDACGANWQTNPVCQTKFFSNYAVKRYGSWMGAYNAWISKHWW